MEKLWTTAEAAKFLGIGEADVEQLVREGKLTGYKLGGQFLRFRPEQVKGLQSHLAWQTFSSRQATVPAPVLVWKERLRDFVYFYDFYIFSVVLLVGVMVYLMASG